MTHDTIRRMLPRHALGALSDEEAGRVEAHLPTCRECRQYLRDYQQVTTILDESVTMRQAPLHLEATLRRRLDMSRKEPEPAHDQSRSSHRSRVWRLSPLAAAVGAALLVSVVAILIASGYSPAQVRASAILASSDALRVALVPDDTSSGIAGEFVYKSNATTAAVSLEHLPPLPDDLIYQLWLIDGDKRSSGGIYSTDELLWLIRAPQQISAYDAIGVTVEPAGGLSSPTGPRVFSADLPSSP